MFPSPCGVLVLKWLELRHGMVHHSSFPSPCGVLVLKLLLYPFFYQYRRIRFRPLAGFWFLNVVDIDADAFYDSRFRPLAGFWFLNGYNIIVHWLSQYLFPSPCGVLVLKCFLPLRCACLRRAFQVSVPLRGSGS